MVVVLLVVELTPNPPTPEVESQTCINCKVYLHPYASPFVPVLSEL